MNLMTGHLIRSKPCKSVTNTSKRCLKEVRRDLSWAALVGMSSIRHEKLVLRSWSNWRASSWSCRLCTLTTISCSTSNEYVCGKQQINMNIVLATCSRRVTSLHEPTSNKVNSKMTDKKGSSISPRNLNCSGSRIRCPAKMKSMDKQLHLISDEKLDANVKKN